MYSHTTSFSFFKAGNKNNLRVFKADLGQYTVVATPYDINDVPGPATTISIELMRSKPCLAPTNVDEYAFNTDNGCHIADLMDSIQDAVDEVNYCGRTAEEEVFKITGLDAGAFQSQVNTACNNEWATVQGSFHPFEDIPEAGQPSDYVFQYYAGK